MVSKSSAEKPLSISNHPALRLPGPSLLHQLVQTDPEEGIPAVDFLATVESKQTSIGSQYGQPRSMSYRQLHDAADMLAARIWDLAKGDITSPKFVVPVLLPQGPELYITLLAILKVGGAFCPLNLDIPLERARFILDDVAATVVVTNLELASRIPTDQSSIVLLHVDDVPVAPSTRPISRTSTSTDWRRPRPSDLAYVMYTSGSTGTPKGVGVSHDAATQSLLAHNRHIPEFSRFLQFAAPTFDVSVFEIFFPLFRGKTLVSCSRAAMLDDLPAVMREMKADACELTPTVAGSLLRKRENVPGLKLLLTIGEMLNKPVVEEFGGTEGGKESILWAMYGPTEAAIHCTLQPGFGHDSDIGNIGFPLDTVSAFILQMPEEDDKDENGNKQPEFKILPQGDIGELAVGGYQVAEGYVNRPEITAKAFISSPYGRLYRTGDKARMRSDGTFECLGRISEGQVKLRGQRIELGEIEHAALRFPGCHSAVAFVMANILVLFCAVDKVDDAGVTAAIQDSCREWLPGFMEPGDIVVMKEFPRLPSGKVDRKGLVAVYSTKMGGDEKEKRSDAAPRFRDKLEEKLCGVGSLILGAKVSPDQHLGRAGMDSLLAIKLVSALREVGVEVAVVDILTSKTISALHERAKETDSMSPSPSTSFDNIDPVGPDFADIILRAPALKGLSENAIEAILPCTPLQTAMLAETSTNSRAYCNWIELSFPPEHTETAILSWFLQLARENESLRTGFVHDGERFQQVIFRELDTSIATISEAPVANMRSFELCADDDFLRPFRLRISRRRDLDRTTVVMQMHHAVYDGWSMDMMLWDLETFAHPPQSNMKLPKLPKQSSEPMLRAPKAITRSLKALAQASRALVRLSKTPTRWPKPGVIAQSPKAKARPQFQQVCAYYNSQLFQTHCDAAREFWAENLAGFQPSPLPKLRAEDHGSSEVISTSFLFAVQPNHVRTVLRSLDAGPQTVFQAALTWVWGSLVGTDDVVIGTVTSGRTIPVSKIEDIIGPCIATMPLRTKLSQLRTMQDLISSVHAANRAVLPHIVLPLAEIKRVAGLRPGQSIYDVLFIYQESLHSKPESSRTIKEVSHQDYLETKLLVEIEPKQDGFVCRLTYHADTFPEEQINILGETLQAVVSHMLNNVSSGLSSVQQVFSPHLLSVYNPNPKTFCGIADLASAVEATAAKFPAKDALCFAHHISGDMVTTTTVTFAGLNKTASQIAWLLRQSGVREGDVVAIVMEKSILLYAGILAILKVGCAYLPLLPSTPISRVDTIFRQAEVKVCVVDAATKVAFGKQLSSGLIDIQSAQLDDFPFSNPDRTCDPGRTSYIIYTSGSTGFPKGVCITQLNIMSNLDVLSRIYPVKDESRLLQSCSQAFDVSVFEIFFAWTQGICLCSATNDTLFAHLEHSIRKLGVTHLSMTPTVASIIAPTNVPKVEFLVTSGEPMTELVARKWSKLLYQGYGPSETTNICSVKKMNTGGPVIQHLGWSFENTSTVVLFRDSMDVVPFGYFGELCFGGDQIAQGYLDTAEPTASNFIDHPTFGRLYRSGDLGRMLPDGSMVITGRVDDQIKIRGQRVELGETNAVVRQSGTVADCTTLFFKREAPAIDQIVTCFVPKDAKEQQFHALKFGKELGATVQKLYQELVARVPGYMVPSLIVPVSMLPVTPSGKLDRERLRQTVDQLGQDYIVLAAHASGTQEDDERWSLAEGQIAEVLSAVFGIETHQIGRWTPLTTLGLDSISAIRVSRQIQANLGKRVSISSILQNSSIAKLAQVIGQDNKAPMTTATKKVELIPARLVESIIANVTGHGRVVEKILPCTPLQEAMLAASNNVSYQNQMLFRVSGNPENLITAWKRMCDRHGILRTCFVSTEDSRCPIAQVVLDKWDHTWLKLEASHKTLEDCIAEHADALPNAIDAMEPAVSFATITENENIYLSFICHHALYDGVAVERLLWEVEQVVAGADLPLPPAYDTFLLESLAVQDIGHDFWIHHLDRYTPKLITGFKAIESGPSSALFVTQNLGLPLSQVNDIVKQLGVSLLSVTQSAWAITLGCLFQTDDICFGNVVSGRTLPIDRIDELVAPCFNTIPIRMDLSDRPRNLDLIKAFQSLGPELMKQQFTPLKRIQSLFSHERRSDQRLLFDTLLLLQRPPRPLDQSLWTLERDDGDMGVPVVCELVPDTQLDLFTVKLHLEQNRFPVELPGVILHLFLSTFQSLLRYPESRAPLLDYTSSGMRQILQTLPFEQPTSPSNKSPAPVDDGSWTATESTIREVLSSLSTSPPDRIRRHTTIYQLGLDSINAVQVASMLRKKGLNVSASDVVGSPTCESLARDLEAQSTTSTKLGEPSYDLAGFRDQVQSQIEAHGISADTVEDIIPCTPLQAGMMAQFIHSGGNDYFNYLDFQLHGTVSLDAVVEAWRSLESAHPILRTTFVPIEHNDCSFAMVQLTSGACALPVLNLDTEQGMEKWRLDAAQNAAKGSSPGQLWTVAVVNTAKGVEMHLAIHHCLYDAHSLQLLLADLASTMNGEELQPLPAGNIKSAVADILGQISAPAKSSEEFWKNQGTKTVINNFPVMTPLRESSRQILVESTKSSLSFRDLEQAVTKSGYTIQVILQAAWTRILASYLGESTVTFGVVLSGRNTEATQNAVFPCITTLPVISTNIGSNHDLLKQMLVYNAELFKQQHQPLARIQQWLGLLNTKLFDTLLVYQKFAVDISKPNVPWKIMKDQATVDYPVSIEVEPELGDKLKYQITFFSDILPKEQAKIILQQFDAFVKHLALDPAGEEDDPIQSLPELYSMLSAEQPELQTSIKFLHQFVELQAVKIPRRPALHFVDSFAGSQPVGREWTYDELNKNGNRIANLMLPYVKTGDLVAIDFDKCPEAFFSILGVLKAGCSFVALDPGAPTSRKQFIVQDSGASLVLTSKANMIGLGFEVSVPVLGIDEKVLKAQPSHPPVLNREVDPSDVCYCLYTSGTTGVPKGCEITHENAVQCMMAFQKIFEGHWTDDSRWLQFASLHFDVSVLEQYWSWSVGITLVGAPRDMILEDLAGTISKLEITHIDLTPSLARLVHPDDVPSLCKGVFITGGESLKQEILDVWGAKAVIYNFYGPTEATIGVTVYPRVPQNGRSSNIGKQFVNVGSYVLKPGTDSPVLRGAVGELCVSGKLVGKGYLKRIDLTAERFPTLEQFGERVYRTGDLVRVLHDGCFDFLGRADDQVKLRGQRLEIGEINHALRTGVGQVKDVATIVVRNEKQQKDFLVSFVVVESELRNASSKGGVFIVNAPETRSLCQRARLACQSRLPGYMVPTYIFQLPFIPLSPNNKAEIKELRRLFLNLSQDQLVPLSSLVNGGSATLSDSGKKVARVVAAMLSLDIETMTPTCSIFELGIDSISVLRLARALRKEGFTHANPSMILRNPALCELSLALDSQSMLSVTSAAAAAAHQTVQACGHRHRSHVCKELAVTTGQIEYIAPCSPLQLGMISRSATDGAYFNTFRFQLQAGTSVVSIHQAWQRTVTAFPILRTMFVKTTDGFVQVALKNYEVPREEVDVSSTTTSAEEVIQSKRREWVAHNSDNLTRPLQLLILNGNLPLHTNNGPLLVLHIFHGLYDANSFKMILDRIASEYLAMRVDTDRHASNIDTGPSFLEALCHGPLQTFTNCKPFWLDHLSGANVRPLASTDSDECQGVVSSRRQVSFNDLESLRMRLGVTHQAIIQAAWCWALSKQFSADPTIGMIISGRAIELGGAEEVVGPLFNTIPFHVSIRGEGSQSDLSWSSLIRQCHDFNSSVLAFQHVPLRDIQKWCSRGRPLFDILFSFHIEEGAETSHSKLWSEVHSDPVADYPLSLEAALTSGGHLCLLVVANGRVVGDEGVRTLLDELEHGLGAMCRDSKSPLLPENTARKGVSDHISAPNESSEHQSELDDYGLSASFTWTGRAAILREEISKLAEVTLELVTERTSIFELGIDSIDVIKLSAMLKQQGVKIKTSQLMKAQTIPAMLQVLDEDLTDGDILNATNGVSTPPNRSSGLEELITKLGYSLENLETVLPATPLQDSMVTEMVESDFQLYFNHDILEISRGADVKLLEEAWMTVIKGSPILRTTFLRVDTSDYDVGYCQIVRDEPRTQIEKVEILGKEELAKLVDAATQRARKGGGESHLLQLTVARAPDQTFLVISIAHALYDGRSLELLHQDVQAAYDGQYVPRPQYESYLDEVVFTANDGALSFWSEFLDGAIPTILPENVSGSNDEERVNRVEAPSSLAIGDIKAFSKRHAITMQTLGQACLAALLASRTMSLDVTFGVVLSGRDSEHAENLMFPTMNTVAMRSILHGTVSSWLRYMQENAVNVGPFQHFPLRKAQKLVRGANGPLFNALFIQQRRSDDVGGDKKSVIMKSVDGSSAVEYPVCVEMEVGDGSLVWRMACDDSYVSREETLVLLHQLDIVLRFFIGTPEADVISFSGQSVSVCGLPEFMPRSAVAGDAEIGTTGSPTTWAPAEERIRQVLADISGVPILSILKTHNIYNLGLDSIGAMRVTSALRKEGITIKFRDMLKAKSIQDMMTLINNGVDQDTAVKSGDQSAQSSIVSVVAPYIKLVELVDGKGLLRGQIQEVLPATAMQVHVISVWKITDGRVFFPEFKYKLTVDVDVEAIGSAWEVLIAETPILRTIFLATQLWETPVVQIILQPDAMEWATSSPPTEDSRTWSYKPAGTFAQQPFNSLGASKEADGIWILRLKIHHALYDAVSLPIIMRRFTELCGINRDQQHGNGLVKPPSTSAWSDMIRFSNTGSEKNSRRGFWTEYLSGVVSIPFDHELAVQTSPGSRVSLIQPSAVKDISGLRAVCELNGVSIQALFLAAYAKFLGSSCASSATPELTTQSRPGRNEEVIFGIYLANRADLDEADSLGLYPTLCLVPLRVRVGGGKTLVEMAAQIQEDLYAISAPGNVGVGLWEVKEWTGIVVDSFVNFLSFPTGGDVDGVGKSSDGVDGLLLEGLAGLSESEAEEERPGFPYEVPPGLESIHVRDAYVNAVDVEVSIQGDSMTIGVFGPDQKLGGKKGARKVVSSMVEILEVMGA